MGVAVTYFGRQTAIFANQDDGIFSAIPVTFDESVLTLETYTQGLRKFVKAGSVVKQGNTVLGITAEEYELTNGPISGRVVLEGYAYVERLTSAAVGAMSLLPKIVPIPYGKILFEVVKAGGKEIVVKVHGSVWSSSVAAANFTIDPATNAVSSISAVERNTSDESLLKITFATPSADGSVSITAIAAAAVMASSGKVIAGLPIKVDFRDGEVNN